MTINHTPIKTQTTPQLFDVIVGNPPYGAKLSQKEQDYLLRKYNFGTTETAILFILKAFDLLKDGGYIGFIIPKSFCFASNYANIRELVWDNVVEIVDCGKVWEEVKLEQIIVTIQKGRHHDFYTNKTRIEDKFENEIKIDKQVAKEFGFFLNGIDISDIDKAQKIKKNCLMLNDIAQNRRGAMLQKFVSNTGELQVIGGAEISRDKITGIKGKINKANINYDKAYIKPNSILVQRIISHIENPIPHIQITACIPNNDDFILVDTINQITLKPEFKTQYVWAILNSDILNWYVYNFILGKAIRTMQFDNPTTSQLPIPNATPEQQTEIAALVDRIMDLKAQYSKYLDNTFTLLQAELAGSSPISPTINRTKNLTKFTELDFTTFLAELTKQKFTVTPAVKRTLLESFEIDKARLVQLQSEINAVDSEIESRVRGLYGVE
jgi:adenine-specific DNA-methyltransferase